MPFPQNPTKSERYLCQLLAEIHMAKWKANPLDMPRKNYHLVAAIIDVFRVEGTTAIEASDVRNAVGILGWEDRWDSKSNIDDHGLVRAIGDIMGGHGMRLPCPDGYKSGWYDITKTPVFEQIANALE